MMGAVILNYAVCIRQCVAFALSARRSRPAKEPDRVLLFITCNPH